MRIGDRWVKKHGNVRPRLVVVRDDGDRVCVRVTDPGGSTGWRKNYEFTMGTRELEFYYKPAKRNAKRG